jgi:hypothetical protein
MNLVFLILALAFVIFSVSSAMRLTPEENTCKKAVLEQHGRQLCVRQAV